MDVGGRLVNNLSSCYQWGSVHGSSIFEKLENKKSVNTWRACITFHNFLYFFLYSLNVDLPIYSTMFSFNFVLNKQRERHFHKLKAKSKDKFTKITKHVTLLLYPLSPLPNWRNLKGAASPSTEAAHHQQPLESSKRLTTQTCLKRSSSELTCLCKAYKITNNSL